MYVTRAVMEKIDRHYERGVKDLAAAVAKKALEGIDGVDYVLVASSLSYVQEPQLDLGAHIAYSLGLRGARAISVEAGEASGLAAVELAGALLKSKASRVLVIGVDKLTNFTSAETYAQLSLLYDEGVNMYSSGFGSVAGILMRLYMERYNVDRLTMAHWPALMHANAKHNPYAMLRFAIAPEKVLEAMPMADPITLMDSFPLGDGAAAILLESRPKEALAELAAVEAAVGHPNVAWSEDPLHIESLALAYGRLSEKHDLREVDVVELHDSFTITALMILESIGLAEKGKAAEAVASGRFSVNGDVAVNPSGGLKARGHPIGATGVYQVAEVALQLAGQFPGLKVEGARKGLAVSLNGFGSSSYVAYLRGVE
ncbi:MAG: thiolase family protein [Acidilobaceae archaeon]|nr:thiolase family protein [Acidilobaceae archaeon]